MTDYNNKNIKQAGCIAPKILVIDDEKLIRWSLKEILTQEGYDVHTADSADEAIKLAKETAYQLIIADWDIKDQSGIDTLKKIKGFRPDVVSIILSAHPKQQIQPECRDLNIFATIEKPFKSEQLLSIAREALDSLPLAGKEAR